MIIFRRFKIREHQRGLHWHDGVFRGVLQPGVHWILDPLRRTRVLHASIRLPWLGSDMLDVMVRSGRLGREVTVIDLEDHERALVWLNGRFERVLGPGLHALWNSFHEVHVEVLDARQARLQHRVLHRILEVDGGELLRPFQVETSQVGLFFREGEHEASLQPGTHAFWKGIAQVRLERVDLREASLDVSGQEIMTADRVTLRMNAVVTFRVAEPLRAVSATEDHAQALYREAQLVLREVVGTRELDQLLLDRDAVASELLRLLQDRARRLGLEVQSVGIRDLILPGDMRELLNQVTEARKAAEAALIRRREETAAMRSQANTARILENNPTLMRMRELEALEKVAPHTSLTVLLGEQGLAERITKLL